MNALTKAGPMFTADGDEIPELVAIMISKSKCEKCGRQPRALRWVADDEQSTIESVCPYCHPEVFAEVEKPETEGPRLNAVVETSPLLKLDLGCGPNKKPGFTGVDRRAFDGVDVVADLKEKWPWEDSSVEEIHMSHILEHFTGHERVHIFNEMHRVLAKGGKATIITPHWCSNRAYGDFTHAWPPVAEFLFYYLSKDWRLKNAPDNDSQWNPEGYTCDFDATWGYSLHPDLLSKSQDRIGFSTTFYKEAAQDIIATLTAKK